MKLNFTDLRAVQSQTLRCLTLLLLWNARAARITRSPPRTAVNRYFLATTIGGAEGVLSAEIAGLKDAHSIVEAKAQVFFQGSSATAFEAIMKLRTPLRILEKVLDADDIETKEDLHTFVGRQDWSAIISPHQSLKVDATIGETTKDLSHSHYSALTVKNAIVDQFRSRGSSERPSVDIETPDLPLLLYLHRGRAILYRVWSGEDSLHKRGYRQTVHKAALRETSAAILMALARWKGTEDDILCDPLCGSGTIAIEAALIASNCSPGLLRYADRGLKPVPLLWSDLISDDGADELWNRVVSEARSLDRRKSMAAASHSSPLIFANDIHAGALQLAQDSAEAAGVSSMIDFNLGDVATYRPAQSPGLVVTNPPWELRLDGASAAWTGLGEFGRREMRRKSIWALSGNADITRNIRFKSSLKIPLKTASVDLRFLRYDVMKEKENAFSSHSSVQDSNE